MFGINLVDFVRVLEVTKGVLVVIQISMFISPIYMSGRIIKHVVSEGMLVDSK